MAAFCTLYVETILGNMSDYFPSIVTLYWRSYFACLLTGSFTEISSSQALVAMCYVEYDFGPVGYPSNAFQRVEFGCAAIKVVLIRV